MRLNFKLTFDASLWLIKKNIKTLLLVSLLNCVGYYLYTYVVLPSIPTFNPSMKAAEVMSLSFKMFIFTIVVNIISSLLSFLEYAFILVSTVSNSMTPPTPIAKQFQYILKRIIPLILTSVLSGLLVFLGTLFFIIPGLLFITKYSQALHFCLIDGENPINSLKYSARITKGNYMRLTWIYFLFSIIHLVLLIPLFLPIPSFLKIAWYSFILTLGILVNYVIWKILKQNFYSGLGYPTMSKGKKFAIAALGIVVLVMIVIAIRSIVASNRRFNNTLNISNVLKQVTPSVSPSLSPSITSAQLPTQIPSPTETPYPTPTGIDMRETNSWQTYTNKSNGYSVRYPLDFVVQSLLPDEPNIFKSSHIAIRSIDGLKYITIKAEDGTTEKMMRQYGPLFLESEMSIPENDTTVMSTEGSSTENSQYYAFIEKNSNHVLVAQLGPIPKNMEKEYKDFFVRIISTVKFKK